MSIGVTSPLRSLSPVSGEQTAQACAMACLQQVWTSFSQQCYGGRDKAVSEGTAASCPDNPVSLDTRTRRSRDVLHDKRGMPHRSTKAPWRTRPSWVRCQAAEARTPGLMVRVCTGGAALAVHVRDNYIGRSHSVGRGGGSDSATVQDDDCGTKRTPYTDYRALNEIISLDGDRIAAIDRTAVGRRRSHTGLIRRLGKGEDAL